SHPHLACRCRHLRCSLVESQPQGKARRHMLGRRRHSSLACPPPFHRSPRRGTGMSEPKNPNDPASRRFDVTVAGDNCIDLLMYGLAEDLPCERELLASDMAIRIGGSGAITAHNLAALGSKVGFITALAGDQFGG